MLGTIRDIYYGPLGGRHDPDDRQRKITSEFRVIVILVVKRRVTTR